MHLDAGRQLAEKRSSLGSVTFEEGRRGGFEFVERVQVKELQPANKQAALFQQPAQTQTLEYSSHPCGKQRYRGTPPPKKPKPHKPNHHNKNPTTSSHFNVELLAHLQRSALRYI